jgi:ATP-binding cassette, subfamily B, bacterial
LNFTFYRQLNAMDCGPTSLRMIAKFYGRHYNANSISRIAGFSKEGVSLLGLSEAAEKLGFRTRGVQITLNQLITEAPLPCILHWDQSHFTVLTSQPRVRFKKSFVSIADPANGIVKLSKNQFLKHWETGKSEEGEPIGIALLLEPSPDFYNQPGEKETKLNWTLISKYLKNSHWQIFKILIALLVASMLQLVFPFLTQSIVDTGINTQNIQFITIVLIAQLMLIFSRTIVDFIRSRILLQLSTLVNLSILSDFWIKLTRLPLSYFDSHNTGDTLQRIGDNKQIQNFLTGSALTTLFSLFSFVIYGFVLTFYNVELFLVFISGAIIYFFWVKLFLQIRRKINYQTFHLSSKENAATLQLVQGMQEIRLNNAEQIKRWEWENIQVGIFKLNFRSLTYNQIQQAGALLINQGKDVIITFLAAKLVLNGQLTLGAMLAIQYIIGQLNGPIEQFVGFTQSAQDAKISMERLNEIHQLPDEESKEISYVQMLPEQREISLKNISFTYPGPGNEPVLENINIVILQGKVTAIVGASGSGKTTLLKLLLKFYEHFEGELKIGESNFKFISPSFWRSKCGAVLQDGYIFNDTIAHNVTVGFETYDLTRLIWACKMANILSFIETLPNGFNTKLGAEGVGLSQGQKQRILIARAVYKKPDYLFFDEATNALDANNEKAIVENMNEFFQGRTVVVVAHRLSTVKNADKIVVLDKGTIAEQGTHKELSEKKGLYYELVKNQLELGN